MALAATGTAVVAASDFVLTRDVDKVVIAITKVTVDEKDDTKVNIAITSSLTDAKDYTLTYKGDAVASFKATDGVITTFDVTPTTVVEGKETELQAKKFAGEVLISEGKFADSGLSIAEKTFSAGGYIDDGKVMLNKAGDTVKIKVQYDTGKFDAGSKVYISQDYEIKAIASSAVISKYRFSAEKSAPNWTTLKNDRTTVALYDGDSNNYKLFFQIKDSDDKDVTATCDYTVESADNTIILVNQDTAIDNDGVVFTTVKTGKTYLVIKDKSGNIVSNLPITVGAARVLDKVTLSKSTVYVTSGQSATSDSVVNEDIKMTVLDQYGDKLDADVTVGNKNVSAGQSSFLTLGKTRDSEGVFNLKVTATSVNDSIQKDVQFPVKASYTNGEGKTTEKTVNVNVRSMVVKGADSYSVVAYHKNVNMSALNDFNTASKVSEVDTTVTATSDDDHYIALPAVWINNNAIRSTYQTYKTAAVTCGSVTLKNLSTNTVYIKTGAALASRTDLVTKAGFETAAENVLSGPTNGTLAATGLVVRASDKTGVTKYLPVGTYEVTYEMIKADNKKEYVKGRFNIVDTQAKVEIVVKSSSADTSDIDTVLADPKKVAVYYGGTLLTEGQYTISAGNVRTNNTNIFVKDASLNITIPGTTKPLNVSASVGRTFTTSTAGWTKASNY